jgi:hypothetical protein
MANWQENDPLPHFTLKLALDIRERLRQRILEETDEQEFLDEESVMFGVVPDQLARQIVSRMYSTQVKEAKAILSFSEAMIDWNNKHAPAAQHIYKPGETPKKTLTEFVDEQADKFKRRFSQLREVTA